jgi:hypothetical protein
MSHLQKKSEDLAEAANLLYKNELFVAVAHSAYYCCLQLMKHIWLHSMKKTERDLRERNKNRDKGRALGTHEFLINSVAGYIKNHSHQSAYADFGIFNINIWGLRNLRVSADYSDNPFGAEECEISLSLSKEVLQILKKY